VLAPWLIARAQPAWLIFAAWLLVLGGFYAALIAGAGADVANPSTRWGYAFIITAPALISMVIGCAHFGWYLAAMSRLGFHNNELGGAAKVDRFRQFIRFRVTPDRVTGYVIGLERIIDRAERPTGADLRPFVLDVFEVTPRPPGPSLPAP
jgi:hypothetical protein